MGCLRKIMLKFLNIHIKQTKLILGVPKILFLDRKDEESGS